MERDIPKYFHFLPVSFDYKILYFIVPFIYVYIFPVNKYFLCQFCSYFGLDATSEINALHWPGSLKPQEIGKGDFLCGN